ncbi:hypothetical protein, partial [Pseudophaeobacter profundi]|uniref:hypothetical protein n=1 Tax=Pseudophaeobacter profundi TaxID=3034152 RepID=UPI002431435A
YIGLLLLAFVAGCVADAIPLAVAEAEPSAEAKPHPIAWPFPSADDGGGGGDDDKKSDGGSGGGGLLGLGAFLQLLIKPLLDLLVSLGLNIG